MNTELFLELNFDNEDDKKLGRLLTNNVKYLLTVFVDSPSDKELVKKTLESTRRLWGKLPEDIKAKIEIATTPHFLVSGSKDGVECTWEIYIPTAKLLKNDEDVIDVLKNDFSTIYLYQLLDVYDKSNTEIYIRVASVNLILNHK